MVKKISVIGAGAVGSALVFHLFSRLNVDELSVVDIVPGLAKGVCLDIEDTRAFFDSSTKITGSDDFCAIANSDIVVITSGVARKEGMSRLDLLKINAKVVRDVSGHIKKHASGAIVITVTNPLDIITYIVAKETGFMRNRVIGMGASLDSARLLNILSQEVGISTASLDGYVFGLHNNDMIVSPNRIKVKSEPIEKLLSKEAIKKIQDRTSMRGGEIVGFLKNRSANYAPSFSCYRLIKAIIENRNEVIPVSVLLSGEYGLNDLCIGVPCIINSQGIAKILEIELNEEEKQKLKKATEVFKEARDV